MRKLLLTVVGVVGLLACGSESGPAQSGDATEPGPSKTTSSTPAATGTSTGGKAGAGAPAATATSTAPAPSPTATSTTPPAAPLKASTCFADLTGPVVGPNYDQFAMPIVPSCSGTHNQEFSGIQKLVFLGDSVTVGTPPTMIDDFYSVRLTKALQAKYPGLEVSSCAAWGAETNDLIDNDDQLGHCFPNATEPKKTLVIMTMGGNDIHGWAADQNTLAEAMVRADETATNLRNAVNWLKAPGKFPNGVRFVYANIYEYTDTSGDLLSCPAASLAGLKANWPQGAPAIVHLEEEYLHVAHDTGVDMIFLAEHFCGHGYKKDDPNLQCYRGPNTPMWFDLTCIHPTPDGHEQIANLFLNVINGT